MKLNPMKYQSTTVSRSRTSYPPHAPLYINGNLVMNSKCIKLLCVTLDDKPTFEDHPRAIFDSIAQNTGLLLK